MIPQKRLLALDVVRGLTIGLAFNAYAVYSLEWSNLRIMGVLQRIAIAYGIASFIVLSVPSKFIGLVIGIILLGYWAILGFFGGVLPGSLLYALSMTLLCRFVGWVFYKRRIFIKI